MRVLYFTKSAGYEHDIVRHQDGVPSHSERVLLKLGAANDIDFVFSKDGSLFSPTYFGEFDAVMFFTGGDISSVGDDGHPAVTPEGKEALLDAIADGMGFLAVHSAGDTWHTLEAGGGNPTYRHHRYRNHGEASDPYVRMLGGEFINHGEQQVATARVVDPAFPGFAGLGATWRLHEEWYSLKEFAADLHVLLVLETAGMDGVDYRRPPFPLAWARRYGRGRVWFTGLAHRADTWDSAAFQAMLLGGLEWAGRRVDADITPNLGAVAPEAHVFPPEREGT
jgi:type 1 glutamine amidotransferase